MLVYTVYWYTIVVSYYDDTNDIYDDSNDILLIIYIIYTYTTRSILYIW